MLRIMRALSAKQHNDRTERRVAQRVPMRNRRGPPAFAPVILLGCEVTPASAQAW